MFEIEVDWFYLHVYIPDYLLTFIYLRHCGESEWAGHFKSAVWESFLPNSYLD